MTEDFSYEQIQALLDELVGASTAAREYELNAPMLVTLGRAGLIHYFNADSGRVYVRSELQALRERIDNNPPPPHKSYYLHIPKPEPVEAESS